MYITMSTISIAPSILPFNELFKAVQLSEIFPDSKTFNDYVPKVAESIILDIYQNTHLDKDFNLKDFVFTYYQPQTTNALDYQSDTSKGMLAHVNELWPLLTRESDNNSEGSLIALPHRYVVPGGRFQEIYYWDSYFTMLGLQASGQYDLIKDMLNNFDHLIKTYGYIPNGNRSYFLGRSQPPFFSLMVELLSKHQNEEVLLQYLPALLKEYQFWMSGKDQLSTEQTAIKRVILMPNGSVLNRYWDDNNAPRPEAYKEDLEILEKTDVDSAIIFRHIRAAAESGWDFSSRWFKDGNNMNTIHTTDIIPVDLNCLLVNLERAIFKGYLLLNDTINAKVYHDAATQREKAIKKYCYHVEKGFYFDYDFIANHHTPHYTLAAVFPLFFNLSNKLQATNVAKQIKEQFLKEGGLITTTNHSGQQWDAPNGWAPLQWMTYQGLCNYGFDKLAQKIKSRWLKTNEIVFDNTGKMTEKYNVETPNIAAGGGEYPNQDGFGWTNGVVAKMLS